jgi:hypothetical protein
MRTARRTPEQERLRYSWITTGQAAEMIGGAEPVSTDHVLALCDDGELEWRDVSRPGAQKREVRINPASVEAFLDRRTQGRAA